MKYLQLFETKATEYRQRYDQFAGQIRVDIEGQIIDKFEEFGITSIVLSSDKDHSKILGDEYYIRNLYLSDNNEISVDCYFPGERDEKRSSYYNVVMKREFDEKQIDFVDLALEDMITIYSIVEDMTLLELFQACYEQGDSATLADLYDVNVEQVNLDQFIGGYSFFYWYKKDSGPFEHLLDLESFQAWLLKTHPEKLEWAEKQNLTWTPEIKAKFPEYFEAAEMGFMVKESTTERSPLITQISTIFQSFNLPVVDLGTGAELNLMTQATEGREYKIIQYKPTPSPNDPEAEAEWFDMEEKYRWDWYVAKLLAVEYNQRLGPMVQLVNEEGDEQYVNLFELDSEVLQEVLAYLKKLTPPEIERRRTVAEGSEMGFFLDQ